MWQRSIRKEKMLKKYGSQAAISKEMRRRAALSKRNSEGKGGFAALTEEERKEMSKRGIDARKEKAGQQNQTSSEEADTEDQRQAEG